ncbi:hypothetical protein ACO0LL_26270 [Undibacterium sp. TC4M20W]|uniref:hypothetical protein n=1 Tax=Undibacterium sp. TC4M20W TaxID=3413052 RepID=UPI003BF03BF7
MTFILRTLSLISAFLMVVCFVMPIMMLGYGTSPIRDAIASVIIIAIAVLAMRCTKWLWRKRRFWTEIKSLSEVSAFGCLLLLSPVVAFLEQRTSGVVKGAIQIAFVLIAVSVYFFVQRYGRTKRAFVVESSHGTSLPTIGASQKTVLPISPGSQVVEQHNEMSISLDLYCKVYVNGNINYISLVKLISVILGGGIEMRSVHGPYFTADVFVNEHANVMADPDDFVEWPLYLEIEPDDENIDPQLYINSLASFISALRANELRVVAACHFEEELNALILNHKV